MFIQKIPGLFCVHIAPKQERRTFGIVYLRQQVFHLVRCLQNGFVNLQARQRNFIVFCNGFFQNLGQLFFFLRTVQKDHRGDGMFCSQFTISVKSSADAGTKPKRMPEVSSSMLMARCFCASSKRISLISCSYGIASF